MWKDLKTSSCFATFLLISVLFISCKKYTYVEGRDKFTFSASNDEKAYIRATEHFEIRKLIFMYTPYASPDPVSQFPSSFELYNNKGRKITGNVSDEEIRRKVLDHLKDHLIKKH